MAPNTRCTFGLVIFVLSWLITQASNDPTRQPVRYVVVVTGGELLAGAYPDGHTAFITRTLRPLGLECVASITVDDGLGDIQEALQFASTRANLVVVTGGLGPTENDSTREAISKFTGIELREDPMVVAHLERRFEVPADQLRPNIRRQARIPLGGAFLENPSGTAVGLVFESSDRVIVALPGPPGELQPMVGSELVPYLVRRFGTSPLGGSLTLRFVGIGQSQIDQTLRDLGLLGPDLTVSSQFAHGRVDFTFSLPRSLPRGKEPADRLRVLRQGLMDRLGDYIYADQEKTSLEDRVIDMLQGGQITLSLAEVGSGGALAAALSGSEKSARVLRGAYVAPSLEQLHALVSSSKEPRGSVGMENVAREMAQKTGSLWAVVLGKAWQDEEGKTWLPFLLRFPEGRLDKRQIRLTGTGESARARLITELLDQLRRQLRYR